MGVSRHKRNKKPKKKLSMYLKYYIIRWKENKCGEPHGEKKEVS
jgi:hypothetical protein